MHTDTTGLVDLAVDTDEEALDAIKNFLSYLPENQCQLPPEKPVPPGSDDIARTVLDVLPRSARKSTTCVGSLSVLPIKTVCLN